MRCRTLAATIRNGVAVLGVCLGLMSGNAYAALTFTYQGRFLTPDGTAPLTDIANITFSIYNSSGSCLLEQEIFNGVDLSVLNGIAAVSIGTGTRTGSDPSLTMEAVLSNRPGVLRANAADCIGGYSPSPTDGRMMQVHVDIPSRSISTDLTPSLRLDSVPLAYEAQKLQGYQASDFILAQTPVTQTNLSTLTNGGNADSLHRHDAYVKVGSANAGFSILNGQTLGLGQIDSTSEGSLTGLTPGSIWYNSTTQVLKYYDGANIVAIGASGVSGGGGGSATNFTGALTGDVRGTQSATVVALVSGLSAANVASGANAANAAASINTANTLVKRDASGDFTAGTITATNFIGAFSGTFTGGISGNASGFTGALSGDVSGTQGATVVGRVGLQPASAVENATVLANAATATGTTGAIVRRDGSGNFSAGIITAALNGNSSTATTANFATTAGSAASASLASLATTANYATTAGSAASASLASVATSANYATTAGSASSASTAMTASYATTADYAALAATVTTNAALSGPISSVGNVTSITSKTGTGTTFVMSASPSIDSLTLTGNVGMGTATPQASLHLVGPSGVLLTNSSGNGVTRTPSAALVSNEIRGLSAGPPGAGTDAGQLRISAGGGTNTTSLSYIDLYGYDSHYMGFGTRGVERMRIDPVGFVGIGTNNPTANLEVASDIKSGGGYISGESSYTFGSAGYRYFNLGDLDGEGDLTLSAEGNALTGNLRVSFNNSSWMGGDTQAAQIPLSVYGGLGLHPSALTQLYVVHAGTSPTSTPAQLWLQAYGNVGSYLKYSYRTKGQVVHSQNNGRSLPSTVQTTLPGSVVSNTVATYDVSGLRGWALLQGGQVSMQVQNGRVGVGTTAPSSAMHVIGVITASSGFSGPIAASSGNFSSGLTVNGGSLTAASGASISSGINANSGGITNAGAISGLSTLTGATSLTLTSTGTNPITFATSGSTAMTILPGGNVGIGTTTPSGMLHVRGSVDIGEVGIHNENVSSGTGAFSIYRQSSDTGRFVIFTNSSTRTNDGGAGNTTLRTDSGDLLLGAGATQHAAITAAGNVGIGTMTPGNPLTLYTPGGGSPIGAMSIDVATFSNPANAAGSYFFRVRDVGGGATPFYIQGTGNVGIGTTSPLASLDVNATTVPAAIIRSSSSSTTMDFQNTGLWIQQKTATANNMANIQFINANGQSNAYVNAIFTDHTAGAGIGQLTFGTANSTGSAFERMRITNEGNVGIGTTAPSSALHVMGVVTASSGFSGTITASTGVFSSLLTASSGLTVSSGNLTVSSGSASIAGLVTALSGINLNNQGITQAGSIDGVSNLTASGNATIAGSITSGGAITAAANGGGALYTSDSSSAGAGYMKLTSYGGSNFIQSGTGSTSGSKANLYFTSMHLADIWMTLSAAGNVGIGTTIPTYNLDVSGTGRFTGALTASSFSGSLTGNVTGSASLNVLKAGDTMTGLLTINSGGLNVTGGNVGIGTSSPGSALQVSGAISQIGSGSAATDYLQTNASNNQSTTALNPGVLIFGNGTGNTYGMDLGYANSRYRTRVFTGSASADISFSTATVAPPTGQSSFTERMTIRGDTGNVGIGTTTPTGALDVNGTIRAGSVTPANVETTCTVLGAIGYDSSTGEPLYCANGVNPSNSAVLVWTPVVFKVYDYYYLGPNGNMLANLNKAALATAYANNTIPTSGFGGSIYSALAAYETDGQWYTQASSYNCIFEQLVNLISYHLAQAPVGRFIQVIAHVSSGSFNNAVITVRKTAYNQFQMSSTVSGGPFTVTMVTSNTVTLAGGCGRVAWP